MAMANKNYELELLQLNELVAGFLRAYKSLKDECVSPPPEGAHSPWEPLSPRQHFDELEGEWDQLEQELPSVLCQTQTIQRNSGATIASSLGGQAQSIQRSSGTGNTSLGIENRFTRLSPPEEVHVAFDPTASSQGKALLGRRQPHSMRISTIANSLAGSTFLSCMKGSTFDEFKGRASVLEQDIDYEYSKEYSRSSAGTQRMKGRSLDRLISSIDSVKVTSPRSRRFSSLVHHPTDCVKQLIGWFKETPGEDVILKIVEPSMGILVLLNCILTGVSLDTEEWDGWYVVDCFFVGLYTIEIGVRVLLVGCREVYCGSAWAWSLFDTVALLVAYVDLVARYSGAVSMFRALRLARLIRLLRLIRMQISMELNLLIRGLLGGARCLVWCIFFLFLPIFIIGTILSQSLNDWEDDLFSTVPGAMFTTLRCLCGDCTDASGRPLLMLVAQKRGWYYACLYSVFILVTILGVLNLITAMFLETTAQASKQDTALQSQIRRQDNQKFANHTKQLVYKLWCAHNDRGDQSLSNRNSAVGCSSACTFTTKSFERFRISDALNTEIGQEFFERLVSRPDIREILDDMGLIDDDIVDLFDMLDVDGSGSLDLTELVTGLHRLRGDASKRDLVALAYMICAVAGTLSELSARVEHLSELLPGRGSMAPLTPRSPKLAGNQPAFPETPREA